MNFNDLTVCNIRRVQLWCDVPVYEKLNIIYCIELLLGCLIGSFEAYNGLKNYLELRKRNNEKYKKFWSDTTNVTFNEDKTQYVCMHLENIKEINIE